MGTSDLKIEQLFPLVKKEGYQITSLETIDYNCIAWAASRNDKWMWPHPDYFWPAKIPLNDKLSSFIKLFESLGYFICNSDTIEKDNEKIAIYVTPSTDIVQHAARQLESGKWTSKLGEYKDIKHTLKGLTKSTYGEIGVIMKRKKAKTKTRNL